MPVKKILVVDDSPTERHLLTELLTKHGYQVITAESGEESIEKAKTELPDLVLMDVVMPGLNGFQATRTLTRDEATKHIPVIVCTSKGQETDKIWGLRQGAQDYLVKDEISTPVLPLDPSRPNRTTRPASSLPCWKPSAGCLRPAKRRAPAVTRWWSRQSAISAGRSASSSNGCSRAPIAPSTISRLRVCR